MNNQRAYIVVFEKGNVLDSLKSDDFHNQFTGAEGILAWWHYLENTYIVIVNKNVTAKNVTDLILQIRPNKNVFVSEINLKNSNGWLPKDAWKWIENNA